MMRALSLALALAGCGITSAGTGTQTLYVEATTEGKLDNTELKVEVRRAGEPVDGANVFVEDVSGANASRSLEAKGNRYEARFPGYVEAFRLKITSGEDELEAALEGPRAHVITNPPAGAVVLRGDADVLTVEWEAEDLADRVIVDPEKIDSITIEGDPREQELSLAGLEDGEQRLRVTRENSIELAGGASGSRWRAQYRVDNTFTLKR